MPIQIAYTEVERLVNKFKHLSTAARKAYNEDNTRKDFIMPLFRALEWDTQNSVEVSAEQSYAEPLRRLIVESTCVESIVDLSGYRVFPDATVETCILILRKSSDLAARRQNRASIVCQKTYESGIHPGDAEICEIPSGSF